MAENAVLRTPVVDGLAQHPVYDADSQLIKQLSKRSFEKEEAEKQANGGADATPDQMTADAVASKLNTNLDAGMTSEAVATRLKEDGNNELEKPPKPGLLLLFIMQLTGFIIVLLMIAAIASLVVNGTAEDAADKGVLPYTTGIAIFVLVFLNAGIAAFTEHQAGGALDALAKMTQANIDVMRDNKSMTVPTISVVRGDIVLLGTGDVVPADMRLFVAEDLKVSEMCLTGEPDDVAKTHKMKPKKAGEVEKLTPENMVFSGCNVTNGKGKGIVVATGMGTRIGKIAALMASDKKVKKQCFCLPNTSGSQTPLQKNVETLGARIGILAIGICVCVFFIGLALKTQDPQNPESEPWLYMILVAVTLAVAAIPEGIPLCVTISLSIGCSDMVKKNVLVRKLAAVETLGSASVICSDKTGTLTEGKMTMVKMWSAGVKYEVSGKGFDPTVGKITRTVGGADANKDMGVLSTLMSAILCCNTTISQVKDEAGNLKWEPKGNSSEAPIVVAGQKVGITTDSVAKECRRTLEIPFSSSRKMMLTVTDMQKRQAVTPGGLELPPGSKELVVCKGAPNYILDICKFWCAEDGTSHPMTPAEKTNVLGVVDEYSSQALRVLAVAIRPLQALPYNPADEDITTDDKFKLLRQDLQLVGLVASIDPAREGVQLAVNTAREAGIRVVMITGDYLKTAIAIAKNVSILAPDDDETVSAVDCQDLRPGEVYLPGTEIDSMTSKVKVFARAKPEDKLEIVKSLQRQNLVSAMTGDGVNDAPALNKADIGVAMGIQGTEVAKGASDMILTDDNFCSIVNAVEKGRAIYAGIQKFVAFIMSVHIAEVMQIFICVVAGMPLMRDPIQILFLILVTDLPPSIALGMEPGEDNILKQRPRPKGEQIILGWMWLSIVINSAILSGVIVAVYMWALFTYCDGLYLQKEILEIDNFETKLAEARTVAFIALVYAENARAYISRSFDQPVWVGLLNNRHMQYAIVAAQICLYAAVLTPFFSEDILLLRGRHIGLQGWVFSLVGPAGTIVLCEIAKIITSYQMRAYQEQLKRQAEADAARKHMDAAAHILEKKVRETEAATITLQKQFEKLNIVRDVTVKEQPIQAV